jgi:hypothetical protein
MPLSISYLGGRERLGAIMARFFAHVREPPAIDEIETFDGAKRVVKAMRAAGR